MHVILRHGTVCRGAQACTRPPGLGFFSVCCLRLLSSGRFATLCYATLAHARRRSGTNLHLPVPVYRTTNSAYPPAPALPARTASPLKGRWGQGWPQGYRSSERIERAVHFSGRDGRGVRRLTERLYQVDWREFNSRGCHFL